MACAAPISSLAAALWQPLCPDGELCSGAEPVFVRDGSALIEYSDQNGTKRRQSVSLDTFAGSVKFVCTTILLPQSRCLVGDAGGGAVFDANGQAVYTFNPTGLDALGFAALHAELLTPNTYFTKTSPPTIFTAFYTSAGTTLYLTRDEGRSWAMQSTSLQMASTTTGALRITTSFLISPDGLRVWLNPGHSTPGLWQTPLLVDSAGQLNFAQPMRVDDGSFPADVFQVRSVASSTDLPGGYSVALAQDGMYVSTDLGRSWQHAAFGGVVDDAVFARVASPDVQAIAARGSVYVSRDRGLSWNELAHGLPVSRYALSADEGALVASGSGVFACRASDCDGPAFAQVFPIDPNFTLVTEFFHAGLGHYFMTGDEGEKSFVRSGGAGAGWTETGQQFWAWSPTWSAASAFVCRFYGDPVSGPNSHFYSASTNECRGLLKLQASLPAGEPRWNSEGYVFKVSLPDRQVCSNGLLPVYRAYNNGFARGIESNHRYVLNSALLAPLAAAGWITEGAMFCVPAAPN